MMKDEDFEKCPMYGKTHNNIKDINRLHTAHRGIVKELRKMSKEDRKTRKYLFKHMDEESIHHTSVTKAIEALLLDKKQRDVVKDKRESFREKLYGGIALVASIGAYNLFMDIVHMRKLIGGE